MAYDSSTWEVVIGLEVHCQLRTQSKIFSGAATAYGAEPNTQADGVTLGMPGVLPVLNKTALEYAVKFGLAVDAKIAERCVFARKHYFYPDLPKRSEEHTSELQSLMRISYAVFCLKKKTMNIPTT